MEFCQGLPRVARERRRGLHLPDSSHTPEKSFRSRLRAFFRCSTSQGVLLLSVYNTEATRPRARNNVPTWRSGTEPIGRNPSALISGSSWRGLEETVEKFASLRDETIMEESKPSGGVPESKKKKKSSLGCLVRMRIDSSAYKLSSHFLQQARRFILSSFHRFIVTSFHRSIYVVYVG